MTLRLLQISRLVLLALTVAGGVARAADATLVNDSVIDPLAHNFPTASFSVATVHGVTFQQDGVTTYKGWQYATYYQGSLSNSNGRVAVARRPLPHGTWETLVLNDYIFSTVDSHNDVVLGICPGDGSIHLSFDHHVNDLNYRVSIPGVADHPTTTAWTPALFGPVTDRLAGSAVMTAVTYPRFIPTPSGKLLFTYRSGGSGGGDEILYEYDGTTRAWSLVGQYTSRSGSYTGTFASGTDRNGYFDNTLFDANGRLHATWCWRETPDASSNHDLLYAYSDDTGRTWKNQSGATIAVAGSSFISINSPGIIGWSIPQRRNYINNSAMTVDAQGRVHVVAWHLPDAAPDQTFTTSLTSNARFIHYWRGTDGIWRKNETNLTGTRAKLSADSDGRLFLVYGDSTNIRIAAADPAPDPEASPSNSWAAWAPLALSGALPAGRANTVNIITDTARWEADRILSVYAQETNTSGTGPTPLHILDYHVSRAAVLPQPLDGSTPSVSPSTLSWTAGQEAVAHDVYFGSQASAVASATPTSPEFLGRQSTTTRSIGPMAPGTTWYWRVDSIDASNRVSPGRVWAFTTETLLPGVTQGTASRSYGGRTHFPVTLQLKDPTLSTGNVKLFLGTTDGGTNATAWQQSIDFGPLGPGNQTLVVDSLKPQESLHYRFLITTIHGSTWASASSMLSAAEDLSLWANTALLNLSGYTASETLADFPVLVRLSPATLPGFAYEQILSPPHGDLRFSTPDGEEILSHEVENWNPAGVSSIWVKLPQLTPGTQVRVWWGRAGCTPPPSAPTWSAFHGVWHLDSTKGFANDSAPFGLAATPTSLSAATSAVIPGATTLNGTSSALAITQAAALNPSVISVEAWVRTSSSAVQSIFTKDQTSGGTNRVWQFRLSAGKPEFLPFNATTNTIVASPDAIHDNQFHHVCGTWDGNTARIYVDGILKNSVAFTGSLRSNQSNRAFIGRSENSSPSYFTGIIDEVRLSPAARSANWVRATFDNQKPGATFITPGPASAPDIDGDQLPDTWEMQHFATTFSTQPDPDNDAKPNLLEFALGTDPKSGAEASTTGLLPPVGSSPPEFVFRQIAGGTGNVGTTYQASGLRYIVEVSTDLDTWHSGPSHVQWSTRRQALPGGMEQVGIHVTSPTINPAGSFYVRLRIAPAD